MYQPSALPRRLHAALRDLSDRKQRVRQSAVRDLARLAEGEQREAAIDGLVQALKNDAVAAVRSEAAVALADCAAEDALEALLCACADPDRHVAQMAILAVGELAPSDHASANEAIDRALRSPAPELRFQAILAAFRLRPDDLEDKLLRAIGDEDCHVRYVALRLCDEQWGNDAGQKHDIPARIHRASEAALRDADPVVAVGAALLLAPSGHSEAARVVADALNRRQRLPEPQDEQALIELAGELGLQAAIVGLRAHLRGTLGLVPGRFAWQARIALARLGDAGAIAELQRGLKSWSRDARTLAVAAVGRARLVSLCAALEQMREQDQADPEALGEALRLLRQASSVS